jgi:ribosomal-protein-serine acetyltransferase
MNDEVKNSPSPILRDLPDKMVGPRILIRPLQAGDGQALWEAIEESREQLAPWLPWVANTLSPDDSEAAARRGASRWLARTDLMVGIWESQTGRYLGGSGLHRIDWTVPAFEIGYWLRTSAWGKGYASETVRLLCSFAFETLGANRVEIRCDAANARSASVPRRLGVALEARLRNHCRDAAGDLRDTLVFAMTPEDYAAAMAEWGEPSTYFRRSLEEQPEEQP